MSPAHPPYPSDPTYRRQPTLPDNPTSLRRSSRSGRRAAILLVAALAPGLPTAPASASAALSLLLPAPTMDDRPGTASDTFLVPTATGIDWYVNGALLDPTQYGKPQPTGGRSDVTIEAKAQAGYALPESVQTTWRFTFTTGAEIVVTPPAPSAVDREGTADDSYVLPLATGVDWYVNGAMVDRALYGKPQPSSGPLVIEAKPQSGYTFPAEAQTTWTMIVDPPPMTVATETLADADRPTTRLSWSSARGVTYDVSYHKVLVNGSAGPEISWFTRTTRETADFVSGWGSQYVVTVIAYDTKGNRTETASASIAIIGDPVFGDIAPGVGTFNSAWQHLRNLGAQRLPYFGDTAALGFRGAAWQFQVPAGTRGLELYATVHPLGAKGRILVNGRDWADVETNTRYWGQVDDPYMYPVRRIQGWDSTRPATITVIVTDGGTNYLALDAYRALN